MEEQLKEAGKFLSAVANDAKLSPYKIMIEGSLSHQSAVEGVFNGVNAKLSTFLAIASALGVTVKLEHRESETEITLNPHKIKE